MNERRSVVIFLFDEVQSLGFSGPADVFSCSNEMTSASLRYDVRTASHDGAAVRTSSGLTVMPDCGVAGIGDVGTLIVPNADGIPALEAEAARALGALADRAQRIASVGTGAFLIAEAGVLDGRRATMDWAFSDELARCFPDITVDSRDTVVKDGHVTTAGGGISAIEMALSLVDEDLGRDTAQQIAQFLVTHLRKPGGQAPFTDVQVREARSLALRQPQRQVQADPGADWTLRSLSLHAGLSERHLSRQFRAEIGMTARQYVERARVALASRLLIETPQSAELIARKTGFGTEATMRKSFLRVLRVAPLEYRRRFS
ncbi:helix-turn-helix domain-containing protein [Streptomyces sp. NPDC020996]|uniref:GlxA family transcriptional regulator n=1 Tax=Streptomyces sp. NPDC020996 TaxID=3154791 RepID=UPI0033C0EA4B